MWLTKSDTTIQKEMLFSDLYTECRQAPPSARLPFALRCRLERMDRKERREIVCRTKEGTAPLFIASKKGNVEIVEYLITQCDADLEQRGLYEVPDDKSIHDVTPLWCAAVAGKLGVVKCLVEHGAEVNAVSDTGSTPVRSACYMTHLDVVEYLMENNADIIKPNYNGGTCLINSVQSVPLCERLIKFGAEVNAQDIQYKTALHYAIQEHRFETTKLLLDNAANPYIESRCGDDALQTACLKGAKLIFNYLIENIEYNDERVAEAHELIGSTFLDEHHDLQTTLEHWRTALQIREDKILPKPLNIAPKDAYVDSEEFRNSVELEALALDLDSMRVQSLLVSERILGAYHKDMVFRLMYRGAAYADSMQYQRCSDLWLYALELRIEKDGLLHTESCFTAQALVRLYLDLLEKFNAGQMHEQVQYSDLTRNICMLARHFKETMRLLRVRPVFKRQQDTFDKILKVVTHLFYIVGAIAKSECETLDMKILFNEILRVNPRNSSGDTLLHMVVSRANTLKTNTFFEDPHTIFPCSAVSEMLLECGARTSWTNHAGSTPLHLATENSNYNSGVVNALLASGAHIDQRNDRGAMALTQMAAIPECNVNVLRYVTLKCLAAREVMRHNLDYRDEIPAMLEDFLLLH
uniref:Uncharacterized protein n=1 Tax=Strigamia maritima TaxID=126957 RepID=T1JDN3_STRMM